MGSGVRSAASVAVHVFVLTSFALAQPLYQVLSRGAGFFVAHGSKPVDLVLLVLILSVLAPAVLLVLLGLVHAMSRRAGRWAQLVSVACLVALILLPALKGAAVVPGAFLIASAVLLGSVFATAYARMRAVRLFLAILSPAVLLFPGLFLFRAPVRTLLFPADAPAHSVPYTQIESTDPVVMLVLDELPLYSLLDGSDRLDPLRYPNLAALARDAYWFRNASTTATGTGYAVPSLLTGRYPRRRGLPTAVGYPENLFTLLAGSGYRVHAVEAQTRLCPRAVCRDGEPDRDAAERMTAVLWDVRVVYLQLVLPSDLTTHLPAVDAIWKGFGARREAKGPRKRRDGEGSSDAGLEPVGVPREFAKFLNRLAAAERSTLYFAHLNLPHVPWKFLPSGQEYGPVGAPLSPHGVKGGRWSADEWEVAQGFQRYLLQVGFCDKLVGELIRRLREVGLYEDSLIVVAADHGASFRPNDQRRLISTTNFADIINIPLLIKLPRQRKGLISDRNVELIDVLPTVAEALGITVPWPIDGQSAVNFSLPERSEKIAYQTKRDKIFAHFSFGGASFRRLRKQAVAHMLSLFGPASKRGGLYAIGPHVELLGRHVSELPIERTATAFEAGVEVELDQPWQYEEVDLDGPFLPVHITGQVVSPLPSAGPLELAFAVNGTIRAVTRSHEDGGGDTRFTAMVSETALVAGRNLIEVFVVDAEGSDIRVQPALQRAAQSFVLVGAPGSEVIVSPSGRDITITEESIRGGARLVRGPMLTKVEGWAAARGSDQPPDAILLFIDGRFVHATTTGRVPMFRRIAEDEALRKSGFQILLPWNATESDLRVYAVLEDVAAEIRLRR